MKVERKVFVVTGGGNGIGRDLVLGLVQKGAKVAAVDLDEKGLQHTKQLADSLLGRISTHVMNITDLKNVEALPDQVINVHGTWTA